MLNKVAKLLLVATSLAPVLISYAFVAFLNHKSRYLIAGLLTTTILLIAACVTVVTLARRTLQCLSFPIASIKTSDSEVLGYVIAYLLPLASAPGSGINPLLLGYVLAVFFLVVWGSHAYHVNPLLGIIGYHFYEVTTKNGVTFLLITKRDIRNTGAVQKVVQLTDYMVLDCEPNR